MDKLDTGLAYVMTKYSEHPKSCGMTPFGHFLFTMRLFSLSFVSSMAFLVHALFPWLLTETGDYLLELLHEHSCPLKSSDKHEKLFLTNETNDSSTSDTEASDEEYINDEQKNDEKNNEHMNDEKNNNEKNNDEK